MGPLRGRQNRSLRLMAAGMTIILFLGLIFNFVPALAESLFAIPIMVITVFLAIALFVNILASATNTNTNTNTMEKRKRALDGLDMYSMIDRLVDDLDEDELDYLRRRLESREQAPPPQQKLAQSIEALLDQRSEMRQNDQR